MTATGGRQRRYRIEVKEKAAAELAKIPEKDRRRISAKIDALAENPRPPQSKKLEGEENVHRVRSGNYRVLYQIQDAVLLVLVIRIGHRRDVYR